MKKTLAIFALTFMLLSIVSTEQAFAQLKANPGPKINCKPYRTGRFEYVNEDQVGISIKRTRKKQIEKNSYTGEKAIFKVKWEEDCKFVLTFVRSNRKNKLRKGGTVETEITEAFPDSYDYKADRYGVVSYGTVKKNMSKAEILKREREEVMAAMKEQQAEMKPEKPADSTAKASKKEGEADPEAEAAGEEGVEKDSKAKKEKKPKKEKPEKEKADKASEDKKEKPPKEKKEKKEKPEKPPKEKKEKPPKEKEDEE